MARLDADGYPRLQMSLLVGLTGLAGLSASFLMLHAGVDALGGAGTKLVSSWLVGRQDVEYAEAFAGDLSSRLVGGIQLTVDGHGPYVGLVEKVFGGAIDYAILVKSSLGEEQKTSAI